VFDLLHRGHAAYLAQARDLGNSLVVAVNTDASARRLDKGAGRPLNGEQDRAALVQRIADAESDAAKVRTLTEWAGHFAAKLDSATYDDKRMALEALGVQVHVHRVGATDEDGEPLPRWYMTMRPLALGAPVVYASASPTTAASRSSGIRRCSPARSVRAPRTTWVVAPASRTSR